MKSGQRQSRAVIALLMVSQSSVIGGRSPAAVLQLVVPISNRNMFVRGILDARGHEVSYSVRHRR